MQIFNDFTAFKEAVRNAYSNNWEDVFNYCGITPSKSMVGSYVYYDGTPICHKEKSPSVQEYPTTLFCHACGESYDIYKLCEMATGKEFSTILNELAEKQGMKYEDISRKDERKNKPAENNGQLTYTSPIVQMVYAAFMSVTHHFLMNASTGQPYRDYLQSRHIKLDFLKTYQFKLSNHLMMPASGCVPFSENASKEIKKHMLSLISNVKDSGINSLEQLEKILKVSKLINKNGNFKLLGRVIFPIVLHGKVVNIYGRKISEDNDYPKHFYLELENHGFYNYDEARKKEYAVGAECIIDAVSLLQYGINTMSTFGVGGWKTDLCIRMLEKSKIKTWYSAYDQDLISEIESIDEYHHHSTLLKYLGPAGTKSAIKVSKEIVDNSNITVRILNLPYDTKSDGSEAKNDINNLVCKLNIDDSIEFQKYFQKLIKEARDFDSTELLLKLKIMEKNSEFYSEHDKMDVILDKLNNMHIINAHHVLNIVSKEYNLPYQLLLTYQMGLHK